MASPTTKAIEGPLNVLDDRLGSTGFVRRISKKLFPDHWSFMLGEIALYSFVLLLLSGVFLTLFFNPSMTDVVYHGSYTKLDGVKMSEAYSSTLQISFDVRGGLLMRQIHHWAALLFIGAMMVHMLRIFFTGAYRKPREVNWIIGFLLLVMGLLEGFFGYSLPDDLLSGTGLRIAQGVIQGVPVVGTYAFFLLFGGQFPGQAFIPRIYVIHILLIPGIILGLITAHLMIMFHQKHTQWPGKLERERNVVGGPFFPSFIAKTSAFMLFVFGVTALLGTFAQINPIWLFGPYRPDAISAGSQPDWYIGFLEGALRMMPNWEFIFAHHYNLSLNVLLPAVIVPGVIFTVLAIYPFVEQWATGDKSYHNTLDRPRNAPTRTAVGVAGMAAYGILWLAGANDIISHVFDVSLFATTWVFRITFFVVPVICFVVTRRICLGMQRYDRDLLHHGVETGIIKRLPSGEFIEVHRPVSAQTRGRVNSKKQVSRIEIGARDENGVPAPGSRNPIGRLRARLNHVYADNDIPFEEEAGHEVDEREHAGVSGHGERKEIESGE